MANRRLIDRLRREGRLSSPESSLAAEHETFPAAQTNIDEEISDRRECHEVIDRLPAGQRDAVKLLKLQEMSLKTPTLSHRC